MDELVKYSYVSILPSHAFTFGFGFLPSLFFCIFLLTRRFMKRMEIAAVILLQMSFEVLLFFLFISFFITTAKVQKIYETQTTS